MTAEYLYFSDCYNVMLFSQQLHSISIIFNSTHWVESRTRRTQTSEISNIHVRVEACILIVSSHPTCSIVSLPDWSHNRSDDLIRWVCMLRLGHGRSKFQMPASTDFNILLNEYCWKWLKFSEIACWKAWHYSSRKNINIQNLSYRNLILK